MQSGWRRWRRSSGPRPDRQEGIALGYTDIGGVVGLGGIGGASIAFGARFERIFKALPNLGDGLLGIEAVPAGGDGTPGSPGGNTSVSHIPIGVWQQQSDSAPRQ